MSHIGLRLYVLMCKVNANKISIKSIRQDIIIRRNLILILNYVCKNDKYNIYFNNIYYIN